MVTPAQVLFTLLSDAEALRAAADGVLTDDEQAALLWPSVPASVGGGAVDARPTCSCSTRSRA